jgi:hypothetical protein
MGFMFFKKGCGCDDRHELSGYVSEMIRRVPVLRYLKDPVRGVNDLYIRYPQGGEPGWFAFVFDSHTFAYWDQEKEKWALLSAATGFSSDDVHMVNGMRGTFNINTADLQMELTADARLVYVKEDCTNEEFHIAPGNTVFAAAAGYDENLFYIIAERGREPGEATLHAFDAGMLDTNKHILVNPVCIGAFYINKNISMNGGIQGFHIRNGDVLVDGRYLPDQDLTKEGYFCAPVRHSMMIDSTDKEISITDAVVFTPDGAYELPAQWDYWNKGGSLSYEGYYSVFAEVDIPGDNNNRIRAVRRGTIYIPAGKTILLGSFHYNGSSVTGISFKNDVYVDDAYIYGSGGGGVPEAPADGRMYGR